MKQWYKIQVPTVKQRVQVSEACKRIGVELGSNSNLRLWYVVHTEFKRITLLQLQFPDLQIVEYHSLRTVMQHFAAYHDCEWAEFSDQ